MLNNPWGKNKTGRLGGYGSPCVDGNKTIIEARAPKKFRHTLIPFQTPLLAHIAKVPKANDRLITRLTSSQKKMETLKLK